MPSISTSSFQEMLLLAVGIHLINTQSISVHGLCSSFMPGKPSGRPHPQFPKVTQNLKILNAVVPQVTT